MTKLSLIIYCSSTSAQTRSTGVSVSAIARAAFRMQADALEIEALAKRRLADEYDAAQERGEVASHGANLRRGPDVPKQNVGNPTAADVGLTRKDIHEARAIRDAEKRDPGIVRRTVDAASLYRRVRPIR